MPAVPLGWRVFTHAVLLHHQLFGACAGYPVARRRGLLRVPRATPIYLETHACPCTGGLAAGEVLRATVYSEYGILSHARSYLHYHSRFCRLLLRPVVYRASLRWVGSPLRRSSGQNLVRPLGERHPSMALRAMFP